MAPVGSGALIKFWLAIAERSSMDIQNHRLQIQLQATWRTHTNGTTNRDFVSMLDYIQIVRELSTTNILKSQKPTKHASGPPQFVVFVTADEHKPRQSVVEQG